MPLFGVLYYITIIFIPISQVIVLMFAYFYAPWRITRIIDYWYRCTKIYAYILLYLNTCFVLLYVISEDILQDVNAKVSCQNHQIIYQQCLMSIISLIYATTCTLGFERILYNGKLCSKCAFQYEGFCYHLILNMCAQMFWQGLVNLIFGYKCCQKILN